MKDLAKLPAFATDELFHVVIESPRGSPVKWKYDPKLGAMSISRPLPLGVSYPCDSGFVPSTQAPDGDPLDAVILWDVTCIPGVVIPCQALAVLLVEQNGPKGPAQRVRNDRVVAMPDAFRRALPNPSDALSKRVRDELSHFFVAATAFEGKDPKILGWKGPDVALQLIREAQT